MPTDAEVIAQVEALHVEENVKGMFELLEGLPAAQQAVADIQWRHGRAYWLMAKESIDDAARREQLMRKGLALVQAAYAQKGAEDSAVNKWSGIMLGAMGEFLPTKEKIANAYTIKDFFLKGVALRADDPTLHHCLGAWCWSVLQIGMIERGLASVIFGAPPSSSFEECERFLMKSFELDKTQIANALMLGDLYYWNRQWDDAKRFFLIAAACPARTAHAAAQAAEAKAKAAKC